MNTYELRYRQVHLDFHTSPAIPEIGKEFNAAEFAAVLKAAHVDSITCFARCHHGMLYYDSKRFPERIHPGLVNKNMLKEMIEECHKAGIRVPIYITVQWDKFTAEQHPEWLAVDEHGAHFGTQPYEPGFYETLCVNTGYRDFLKEQIAELFESLDVDGIFMDIVYPTDCSCSVCRSKMRQLGIDASEKEERMRYAQQMIDDFKRDISAYIRSFSDTASIFYNTSHIGIKQRDVRNAYTHFELESLPSGNWGYIHFPVTMRYARTLGLDCLAHTGKFHLEWGDFHSFKNQEALEYECFRMLALGSKCLIGDQMEPCGRLSGPVYDLIGKVYEKVEALEPWCRGARETVDFAVLSPEEFRGGDRAGLAESIMGAENMLDQLAYQYNIIDTQEDFSRYPLLILPDDIRMDTSLYRKIQKYLEGGGKIIATYESGLAQDGSSFLLKEAGIGLVENPTRTPEGELARGRITNGNEYVDYILPQGDIGKGLPETEHVMYSKGLEIEVQDTVHPAQILADFVKPYFDRTYEHFCSHRQTPSSGIKGNPAIVKNGNIIYFASPVFSIYQARAPRWCRILMKNALEMLLPEKTISHNGPTTVFAGVNYQEKENREIVHLLHYVPEKRCTEIHTIEDIIPLYHLQVELKCRRPVKRVELALEGREIHFCQKDGKVTFEVEKLEGYQVVAVEY